MAAKFSLYPKKYEKVVEAMSWSSNYLTRLHKEIESYKDRMLKAINSDRELSRQKKLLTISQELDQLILGYQNFSRNLNLYQTEPYTVDFYMDTQILPTVIVNEDNQKYAFCESGSSIWSAYTILNENQSDFIIVQERNGRLKGVLKKEDLKNLCAQRLPNGMEKENCSQIGKIFDQVPVSIFILDEDFFIEYANTEAIKNFKDILPRNFLLKKADLIFSGLFSMNYSEFMESSLWHCIKTYANCSGVEALLLNYITLAANIKTVQDCCGRNALIISFMNVDDLKQKVEELALNSDDLIQALRLFVPYQVEKELRTIPEYRDIYNQKTKKITIISKINDGGYWHVINCLRILAQLDRTGVFEKYDIDKEILVQAIIVHDIGKKQPQLDIGDTVDPESVFEPGKCHARRSAVYCREFGYRKETVLLVKYHHHHENELPISWSQKLRLAFRIFKLIDGLSAAVTRRNAMVYFELHGDSLIVRETNKERPEYSHEHTLVFAKRNCR